ncbi:hypothetical protein [Bacillus ndiopicus]|uniref:hypothetical protein n=1 Tax=Bacillus ndiopicus TaxID=1347368 RepID=UPI0005AA7053|nr:hypothetical protein [Bacillus ndiopicus]
MENDLVIYYSYNLNWHLPKAIQNEAKEFLCQIANEQLPLIFPKYAKECWENAVDIIISVGYPNNELALPKLYELFKDLNWPGASKALEYLKGIERLINVKYLEIACVEAVKTKDTEWLYYLYMVSEELNINKDDFKDVCLYNAMKKVYEGD